MNKKLSTLGLVLIISGLTACSSLPSLHGGSSSTQVTETPIDNQETTLASSKSGIATNQPTNTFSAQTNASVGGSLTRSMDADDKIKMSRSLDKALGKKTEWKNEVTGITYAVVPVKKVTIGDNHFCRVYTMTATRGDTTQELNETACIGQDGEWHPA